MIKAISDFPEWFFYGKAFPSLFKLEKNFGKAHIKKNEKSSFWSFQYFIRLQISKLPTVDSDKAACLVLSALLPLSQNLSLQCGANL